MNTRKQQKNSFSFLFFFLECYLYQTWTTFRILDDLMIFLLLCEYYLNILFSYWRRDSFCFSFNLMWTSFFFYIFFCVLEILKFSFLFHNIEKEKKNEKHIFPCCEMDGMMGEISFTFLFSMNPKKWIIFEFSRWFFCCCFCCCMKFEQFFLEFPFRYFINQSFT